MAASGVLNRTQLEILQMFKSDLNENELLEIKRIFTKFLSDKAAQLANRVWEENAWTNDDMKELSKR